MSLHSLLILLIKLQKFTEQPADKSLKLLLGTPRTCLVGRLTLELNHFFHIGTGPTSICRTADSGADGRRSSSGFTVCTGTSFIGRRQANQTYSGLARREHAGR